MAIFIPVPNFSTVPDYQSNPFITGLEITVTGNTTFTVNSGSARALTSDFVMQYPGYLPGLPTFITADISTVGENGCFPSSIASLGLASDTMFPVYLIANSGGTTGGSLDSNVAPVVVVATGNNFLPAGFDAFRRIGWVYVDSGTGNLIYMAQSGKSNNREYRLNGGPVAVNAGSATTATSVDLTTGDGIIPPSSGISIILGFVLNGNAAGAYVRTFPTGHTSTSAMAGVITPVTSQNLGVSGEIISGVNASGNASIDYLVNNASTTVTIVVSGFVDSLGASLV